MPAYPASEYVDHIAKEYLSTFVKEGGATIKFVVLDEAVKPSFKQSMKTKAEALGYQVVDIDSARCRVHMPQDLFFALARQVNWRWVTRKFILDMAVKQLLRIDGVKAEDDDRIVESIAKKNDIRSDYVVQILRPVVQKQVLGSTSMAKDFKIAMLQLCESECVPEGQDHGEQPIVDWLGGRLRGINSSRMSSVKQFGIYTPISRTTARIFLESTLHWFREVGISGTLIMLDNSRVTVSKQPQDGSRYYTRPMTLDHYELLRQCIDGAERLRSTIMLTISSTEFLDQDTGRQSRGMAIYQALKTRIADDVSDKNLANPNAPLIRLN